MTAKLQFTTAVSPFAATITHVEDLSSVVQANIFSGAKTIYGVQIDASGNTGEDVFVRFWNATSATIGTDDCEMVLKAKAGTIKTYMFKRGIAFGTGVSMAAVQSKGGKTGTTAPTGVVDVAILSN